LVPADSRACVFLAVLFAEDPVGFTVEAAGLSAKDQARLQKVAAQALA
jgi:hypothetical protein